MHLVHFLVTIVQSLSCNIVWNQSLQILLLFLASYRMLHIGNTQCGISIQEKKKHSEHLKIVLAKLL